MLKYLYLEAIPQKDKSGDRGGHPHHLSKRLLVRETFLSAHLDNFSLCALKSHLVATKTFPKLQG